MPAEVKIEFSVGAVGEYSVAKYDGHHIENLIDVIAEEVPVAFVYNGVSHAVMLATPQNLEDFALGFSLSEGIVDSPSDLYSVEVFHQVQGIELHLEISTACFQRLKEKRRNLTGRTGCGLCGSESLEQALRIPVIPSKNPVAISSDVINLAFANIRQQQQLQTLTGATHASAWVNLNGEIEMLREDVGRHNALDKLVGTLAKSKHTSGFIFTTSRASYEMVQKTLSAGCNILVAISAPTGLAIRVAKQCGLTLVGFVRESSYVVYSHPENIN